MGRRGDSSNKVEGVRKLKRGDVTEEEFHVVLRVSIS